MSVYTTSARWCRKPDERFLDRRYSRAHEWTFDGGARVAASSSPHVAPLPFSDAADVDPEVALGAALAAAPRCSTSTSPVEFRPLSWYEE